MTKSFTRIKQLKVMNIFAFGLLISRVCASAVCGGDDRCSGRLLEISSWKCTKNDKWRPTCWLWRINMEFSIVKKLQSHWTYWCRRLIGERGEVVTRWFTVRDLILWRWRRVLEIIIETSAWTRVVRSYRRALSLGVTGEGLVILEVLQGDPT